MIRNYPSHVDYSRRTAAIVPDVMHHHQAGLSTVNSSALRCVNTRVTDVSGTLDFSNRYESSVFWNTNTWVIDVSETLEFSDLYESSILESLNTQNSDRLITISKNIFQKKEIRPIH